MATIPKSPLADFVSTTLNGSINDSETSIDVNSATNITYPSYAVIDREDNNGNATPNQREVVKITNISSNTLTVTRGVNGSTARAHNDSALFEPMLTVGQWDDMYDAFDEEHGTDGTHDATKVAMLAGTQTITGNKTFQGTNTFNTGTSTFASGKLAATSAALTTPVITVGSDAQGDVYYRDGSGLFSRLGAGTAGQFLKTMGAGANPQWGAGLSAKVGTFTITNAGGTGNKSVTGVGFKPKLLGVWGLYDDGTGFTMSGIGWTDGTSQFAQCIADAGGTTNSLKSITDGFILMTTSGGVDRRRAAIVSFDTDGFTFNASNVDGTGAYDDFAYIAIG